MKELREKWIEIIKLSTKNGDCKLDYKKNYLNRYNSLVKTATELGVTVSAPLRNPDDIKAEIAAIFMRYETDPNNIKIAMNDMLEKDNLANIKTLPKISKVNAYNRTHDWIKKMFQ